MSTTTTKRDSYARTLNEGYGSGSWHGPDMKAALEDVTPRLAFRRPADGRHSIAEIALHHAYTLHGVRQKLSGQPVEPFILEGEDWFPLEGSGSLTWDQIRTAVEREHAQLSKIAADVEEGNRESPLPEPERSMLVLGATCHAVYHAGQVQLIKRLIGG
jgi:hypothetical protein